MVGVCAMCAERAVKLTEHHVVEAPKDENGCKRTLDICDICHVKHNLYINALISNKIPYDRQTIGDEENEKIKRILESIDSFLVEKGGDDVIDNWDGQTPRTLLEFIKKNLEKMTLTDDQKTLEAIDNVVGISLNNPVWSSPNEVAKMVLQVRDILSGKKS